MQTFLTHPSFRDTASSLDSKRLNKQRVECKQIYHSLTGLKEISPGFSIETKGWQNHPAVLMWKGSEALLCLYAWYICIECDRRGIADNTNMKEFFNERMNRHPDHVPFWWSTLSIKNALIESHRSNLIRKDAVFYKIQFPETEEGLEYLWPSKLLQSTI